MNKREKRIVIDGLEDFPLEVLGLTSNAIKQSNGYIIIPIELLPFLKICKMPKITRMKKAEAQNKYNLRLKYEKK